MRFDAGQASARKLGIEVVIDNRRRRIEDFSRKLNKFKRIAMRVCNSDRSFDVMIHLAATATRSR